MIKFHNKYIHPPRTYDTHNKTLLLASMISSVHTHIHPYRPNFLSLESPEQKTTVPTYKTLPYLLQAQFQHVSVR
jgi:hypothetical protein